MLLKQQHSISEDRPLLLELKEVSDQTLPLPMRQNPSFCFRAHIYLNGGGIDSGFTEIMTNALGEYIAYNDNAKQCVGVVGSGNKNFN